MTFWGLASLLNRKHDSLIPFMLLISQSSPISCIIGLQERAGFGTPSTHARIPLPVKKQQLLLGFEGVGEKLWHFVWVACAAAWESGRYG